MKKYLVNIYTFFYDLYVNVYYFFLTGFNNLVIEDSSRTIKNIINLNKSLVRFGDGEFNIINRQYIGFQEFDVELSNRLKEVLFSDNDNVMIAIPRVSKNKYLNDLTQQSKTFWKRDYVKNRKIWKKLDSKKTYYDASVSRPYIRFNDIKKSEMIFALWKTVWRGKDILIVEGKDTKLGVNNDLFDGAKSISRVICPNKNAYSKYDIILNEILKLDENYLILLALGPTATILAYDLAINGRVAIDIGHIDIEYEWYKLKTKERVLIPGKYVNEVDNGDIVASIYDKKYINQIIKKII